MGWNGSKQASGQKPGGSFSKEATARWGQTPAATSQGTNRPVKGSSGSSRRYVIISALLLIVFAGGVAWWLMRGQTPATADPAPAAKTSPTSTKTAHRAKPVSAPTHAMARTSKKPQPQPVAEPAQPKTPEELEAEARAKDPLYDRHHIVAAKPLVAEAADQLIVTIFSVELGDMPPFIPPLSSLNEEKTKQAIDKLEKASADDTPQAREAKEIVNAVKKELKKFLDEGGTVNGFLAHYANELQTAFEDRKMYQELFSKSIRTDDPAVAREVYKKYNERLAERGIKPLTLNRRQREYLGMKENE